VFLKACDPEDSKAADANASTADLIAGGACIYGTKVYMHYWSDGSVE
jgi:hypothetical protein